MIKGTVGVHNPQILDTKVLLLTGAGASKPLGMPLMREFYNLVREKSNEAQREFLHDILQVHTKGKRRETPDLEALLALVERYGGFYDILFEDGKFGYHVDEEFKKSIEEWKESAEEEGKRAEMAAKGLLHTDVGYSSVASPHTVSRQGNVSYQGNYRSYLQQAYYRKGEFESLDTLLRDLMFEVYGKDLDDRKLSGLYIPFLGAINKHFSQGFIPIFTANYDIAIETYAEQNNIHLETGFESTYTGTIFRRTRFDEFEPSGGKQSIVLFKLHGSLNWHRKDSDIVQSLPVRDPGVYKSVVIYPTQNKEFPDEEPFRTMYDWLKKCLGVVKLAVVIGYSFRDPGIQRIMIDALDLNPNLHVVLVCGPNVERWKKFTQQKPKRFKIIPYNFDFAPSGGEYLKKLDAALAKLKF